MSRNVYCKLSTNCLRKDANTEPQSGDSFLSELKFFLNCSNAVIARGRREVQELRVRNETNFQSFSFSSSSSFFLHSRRGHESWREKFSSFPPIIQRYSVFDFTAFQWRTWLVSQQHTFNLPCLHLHLLSTDISDEKSTKFNYNFS